MDDEPHVTLTDWLLVALLVVVTLLIGFAFYGPLEHILSQPA